MLSACQALKFGASLRSAETMVADSKIRPTKDDRQDIGKFIAAMPTEASIEVASLGELAKNFDSLFDALEEIRYAAITLTITRGKRKPLTSDDRFWAIAQAFSRSHKSFKSEATKIGLQAARDRGRIGGRTRKLSPDQILQAREMRSRGAPVREICEVFGIGRTTYYEWAYVRPFCRHQQNGHADRL